METQVKHRIVGSLVLLSLAIIILPFWLDGAGLEEHQTQQTVPPMPAITQLVEIETVDPSNTQVIALSPIEKAVEPVKLEPVKTQVKKVEAKTPSLLDEQGLPIGWVVQLGSFGNKSNALRLRKKLIKANFPAYMVPKGEDFRILVGPEIDRVKAEALQQELKKKFKMTGFVMNYEINKP
jgi:DedD protein